MLGMRAALLGRAANVPAPPPSYGPELVVNGTFASDIAGWDAGGGPISWVAGKLRRPSPGDGNYAQQLIAGLTPGALYNFRGNMAPSELDRARIRLLVGASEILCYADVGGSVDISFTPSGSGVYIVLEAASLSAWASAGEYADFDNLSLRERL
ncbi:MAG: hypothetical protein ABIN83_00990 [Sphingomicrobium sp.]